MTKVVIAVVMVVGLGAASFYAYQRFITADKTAEEQQAVDGAKKMFEFDKDEAANYFKVKK